MGPNSEAMSSWTMCFSLTDWLWVSGLSGPLLGQRQDCLLGHLVPVFSGQELGMNMTAPDSYSPWPYGRGVEAYPI